MRKLFKEPLLHFFVLGALVFALNTWRQQTRPAEATPARIEVTAMMIDRLRSGYERQFGQAPNEAELRELVKAHIREEVLCREALALGLDRNDTIVRRRMAQKMEFLTADLTNVTETDEVSVREYFAKNAGRYARPAQVSFRQVYFSAEKRGAKGEAAARDALASLANGASDETMGDAFLHGFEFAERETQEITALFGGDFAAEVGTLPAGEWRGPVLSTYGFHLVRVEARGLVQPASFDVVREIVLRDFNEERRDAANREIFGKLLAQYQVEVDEAALVKAAVPAKKIAQR
jgi:hypothetical protein